MNKVLAAAFLLLLAGGIGVGWYVYQDDIGQLVRDFEDGRDIVQERLENGDLLPVAREVSTPPPLRKSDSQADTEAQLTVNGVLGFTNQHRLADGKQALAQNALLNQAAQTKLEDMFARQYFDHIAPTGEGPADLVEATGYFYIRAGENLALGNFPSDEELVQAWMDSPGHRENMLSSGFTEIGIAVGQGTFEGKQTWMAVQTFATPASECPLPDKSLQQTITSERTRLDNINAGLAQDSERIKTRSAEIKSLFERANARIEEGNDQIREGNRIYEETGDEDQAQPYWDRGKALQEEGEQILKEAQRQQEELREQQAAYNEKIAQLHEDTEELRKKIDTYNQQVRTTNTCIEKFSG